MLRFLAVLREEEHLLRIYAIGLLRMVGGVFPQEGQGDENQKHLFALHPSFSAGLDALLGFSFPFPSTFWAPSGSWGFSSC